MGTGTARDVHTAPAHPSYLFPLPVCKEMRLPMYCSPILESYTMRTNTQRSVSATEKREGAEAKSCRVCWFFCRCWVRLPLPVPWRPVCPVHACRVSTLCLCRAAGCSRRPAPAIGLCTPV